MAFPKIPQGVITYGILGGLLMVLFGKKGRKGKQLASVMKGAAIGGLVGFLAPKVGVKLPGTGQAALPPGEAA